MNVQNPTLVDAATFEPSAVADAASNWRGVCTDLFARGEAAVTETLLVLAGVRGRGDQLRLPHLVGERFETLATAIGAGGAFEELGSDASAKLAAFRTYDPLGVQLCHGVTRATARQPSGWKVALRVSAFRNRTLCCEVRIIDDVEASEIVNGLAAALRALSAALGSVRARAG